MSTGAWIAAALAVGVGGVYLLARREDADEDGDDKSGGRSEACEAAAAYAGWAGTACDVASDLLDPINPFGPSTAAHNRKLNGKATRVVHKDLDLNHYKADFLAAMDIEFENGCVPIEGRPGWEKCAKGTKNILGQHETTSGIDTGGAHARTPGAVQGFDSGQLWNRKQGSSGRGDILTHKHDGGKFPLPVPAGGTGYWHRGQPVVCAAGTGLGGNLRDHRTGANPCQPIGEDGTINGILPPRGDGTEPLCDAQGRAPDGKPRKCTTDHRTSPPTSRCNCRVPSSGSITVGAKPGKKAA